MKIHCNDLLKKSEAIKAACLINEILIELTADSLPFPLYLHGFAYGRTHKKSL